MERWLLLIPGALGFLYVIYLMAMGYRGLLGSSSHLNSTESWTPERPEGQEPFPRNRSAYEWAMALLPKRLEPGETLIGYAVAQFDPPPRQNWGLQGTLPRRQLLIAVTEGRLLMLNLSNFPRIVLSSCAIGYDALESMVPPKPGPFGTTSGLRFRVASGGEYRIRLHNPIIFPEFLRYEHRLAAHLRALSPQLPLSGAAAFRKSELAG